MDSIKFIRKTIKKFLFPSLDQLEFILFVNSKHNFVQNYINNNFIWNILIN